MYKKGERKMMKQKVIFLIIVILIMSCEKDSTSSNSDQTKPEISPLEAQVGTSIKLFDNFPDGTCVIEFADVNDFVRADSIVSDTIFTTVPYSAKSGDVNLYFKNDTIKIENFIITEESPDSVKICWSDLNYKINKEMSIYHYMTLSSEFKWTVDIVEDTVKISAGFFPGDYSVYYHLFLLNKGVNKLPKFLSGYAIEETDYGEENYYPLDKGIIKIQDWNTEEIISGKLFSTPWQNNNYCFWYDFKE